MDAETIALGTVTGGVVSLFFNLFPGIKAAYEQKTSAVKQQIMIIVLLVVTAVLVGASCLDAPFVSGISCDQAGVWDAVMLFVSAVVGNQSVYSGTKHLGE